MPDAQRYGALDLALKETFEGIPIKEELLNVTGPTEKYQPPGRRS
jgi:hypothetical protein